MWFIHKYLMYSIIRYPAHIGINVIKHNKVAPNVDSRINVNYGEHRLQRYDVHTHISNSDMPTLFYIHGGSWMSMDKKHYNYIVKTIAEEGYRVVNINYRMLPKYDLSHVVEDCETAIAHAIDNIQGINLSKLLIAGDSAGGHLAALIAAKASSSAFRKKINFLGAGIIYGLFDIKDMIEGDNSLFRFLTKYFRKEVGSHYVDYLNEFSPIRYFKGNFPPTFIASGMVDPLNPASMSFIRILEKNGIRHLPLIFNRDRKDGLHGFFSMTWTASHNETLRTMLDFFKFITSE